MSTTEVLELIVIPLLLLVSMAFLAKTSRSFYWGVFACVLGVELVILVLVNDQPFLSVNGPLSLFAFLFALPLAIAFTLCRLQRWKDRPILLSIIGPLTYLVGIYMGITLGVSIGALEP